MTTGVDTTADFPADSRRKEPFLFGLQGTVEPQVPKVAEGDRGSNQDASLLQKFANETSAHGCAHAASSSRGAFSRGLWALAVAFMLGSMIYILYSMLAAYDQYPVNTLTKVTAKASLPFPGVTLCNINEVDMNKTSLDTNQFRFIKAAMVFGLSSLNASDPVVSEILNTSIDTVVNCSWIDNSDFLVGCMINSQFKGCSDVFTSFQSTRTRCITVNTNHSRLRSMTYAGPNSGLRLYINVHQDGYAIGDSVAAGVKLYVHEPGHPPDLHSSGLVLSPGFSNYVAARPVQYKFLPSPYKAFGDQTCVDVNDPSDPSSPTSLRLTDKYSYAACNLECTVDYVANLCGCRGVLNAENASLPMCTVGEFYACYDVVFSQAYFNISVENRCGCPRPCEYTEYLTQVSSAYFPSDIATAQLQKLGIVPQTGVRENYMELRIYLDKLQVEEVIHEPVYTYATIMGTIGGQMGFFLGASVLTVAELAELCFCFLFKLFRRMSIAKQRAIHQARAISVRPKPSAFT